MFDLTGYTPEAPKSNDFEMMKGRGHVCKVNSSIIEDVPAGVNQRDGQAYDGYKRLSYELEVISDQYTGRRVWKNVNLDSDIRSGKAQKTPIEKLADTFFAVGLEFSDLATLEAANEKFAEMELDVSFSSFKNDNGEDVQMHYINGIANQKESKSQSVPF